MLISHRSVIRLLGLFLLLSSSDSIDILLIKQKNSHKKTS